MCTVLGRRIIAGGYIIHTDGLILDVFYSRPEDLCTVVVIGLGLIQCLIGIAVS